MPDEGQFAELVRHVHAVADDEFVGADEAAEIRLDIGGEMAGLFQKHRRQDTFCAARGDQVLGIGKRAARIREYRR